MKSLYQLIKKWWRGKLIPYSTQEIIDLHNKNRKLDEDPKPIPVRFDPPFIARIVNPIRRFWLKRWIVLLPVIVALIGIGVMLFVHFDSKPKG